MLLNVLNLQVLQGWRTKPQNPQSQRKHVPETSGNTVYFADFAESSAFLPAYAMMNVIKPDN